MGRPRCLHCDGLAEKITDTSVRGHRRGARVIWLCRVCDAWVGCRRGTDKPLGLPANAEVRAARRLAHSHFDQLWKSGEMTRTEAYKWLSSIMGVRYQQAHIALFDADQCRRVIEMVKRRTGL